MKRFNQFLIFIGLIVLASCSTDKSISEEQVKQLIAQVDVASQSMNANGIANVLSENVSITMNLHTEGTEQNFQLTKPTYIAMLHQGWEMASKYTFTRSNVNISISENKATVTSDFVDALTISGNILKSSSSEVTVIEVIDGDALITSVSVNAVLSE